MAELKTGLKGFTIMESLVAMIIIALSFSAAGMIYVNIMNTQSEVEKRHADKLIDEAFYRTENEKRFIDEKWDADVFRVIKTVTSYKQANSLSMVQVSVCRPDGKKISSKKKLLPDE